MNDIWSKAIVLLIAHGIFVLSLLVFSPKRRQKYENRYLAAIILVFLWFLFEFYCVRNTLKIPINFFYGTRYGSWMVLGPLSYFFFRSATQATQKITLQDMVHFLPFFLFVFLVPVLSQESLSSRQIHYGMLAVFDHRPKTVTLFEYIYSTVFYLQFFHLATYLILNQFMLRNYIRKLRAEFTSLQGTRWLFIFNGLFLLILILVSAYLYILFMSDIYTRVLDYIYVLPLGLFIYLIGYTISGMDWLHIETTKNRYQTSTLKKEEKRKLQTRLEEVMRLEKPYLINELRLNDLAELLPTSTHHLSQVLNEQYQKSFFDFINQYRVSEAKKIIGEKPSLTLLQVGFEAGFNNKTSFINAFKRFEGMTPSTYRKTILKGK